MHHHLVIEKIVAGGQHDKTIDDHEIAPMGGSIDVDGLELGGFMSQVGLHGPGLCQSGFRTELGKPFLMGGQHVSLSLPQEKDRF